MFQNYPLDIRQSDEWLAYLEFLGWQKITTSGGVKCAMMQDKLGSVIKVQRPEKITSVDLQELDEIARKNKIALIKIEPVLDQDLAILSEAGFTNPGSPLCPPATLFIHLEDLAKNLKADLSGSARYSIRRAKREGAHTQFFVAPSKDKVKEFYAIHKSTGKQKSFYIQSYEDIQRKADLFGEKCVIGFVYAEDGAATGANMYLGYGDGVWYMHGGTTTEGRNTKNGYALYWDSILFLKGQGYKWLDLEGLDDKRFPGFTRNWGGLSHFKEKFGGERVEFPAPKVKFYKPLLRKISRYFKVSV